MHLVGEANRLIKTCWESKPPLSFTFWKAVCENARGEMFKWTGWDGNLLTFNNGEWTGLLLTDERAGNWWKLFWSLTMKRQALETNNGSGAWDDLLRFNNGGWWADELSRWKVCLFKARSGGKCSDWKHAWDPIFFRHSLHQIVGFRITRGNGPRYNILTVSCQRGIVGRWIAFFGRFFS